MIVKAEKEHIPLIVRRLGEFKKVSREYVNTLLNDPREIIWIDESLDLVCRIQVKEKENLVTWLLPANAGFIDLFYLLSKALIDIYNNFPEMRGNKTSARFADGRGCTRVYKTKVAKELAHAWQLLAPSSTHIRWRIWDNSWILYAKHEELVMDILNTLEDIRGYGKTEHSYSYI